MIIPPDPIPRKFYRAAFQRLEDAQLLLDGERWHSAIYLAGYAVECMLKALILNAVSRKKQPKVETEFRGQKAHDFEWLLRRHRRAKGPAPPREVNESLVFLSTWHSSLRYEPDSGDRIHAGQFVEHTRKVLEWADTRL